MGQAEQSHRPIEVGVEAALDALELVGGAHQLATVAGLRVDGAEGAGVTQARIGFLVFGADLAFPAAAQLLFEGAEGAVGVPLEAVPVDIEVGVAGQSEIGPILGHRYPGHVGDRVDVLVLRTDGEQGVGAQVELGHPVEQAGTLVGHVVEVVAVLVGGHRSAAHVAAGAQRAADVDLGAVAVPAPGAEGGAGGELALRPLAHQVDGGRRVAGAMQQSVGAAEDLDPLVDRHVLRRTGGIAEQCRHPVQLEGVDLEAAHVVGGGQQLERLHGDPGGLLHGFVEAEQVLLFEALMVDDTGGLRQLARLERHLAQGSHPRRLGGGRAFSADHHVRQFRLAVLARVGHGRGQRTQRQQQAQAQRGVPIAGDALASLDHLRLRFHRSNSLGGYTI